MAKTELTGGKVPRMRRAGGRAFDAAKQARFLAELAATCNVSLAAERAGISSACIYAHRARDAGFGDDAASADGVGVRRRLGRHGRISGTGDGGSLTRPEPETR